MKKILLTLSLMASLLLIACSTNTPPTSINKDKVVLDVPELQVNTLESTFVIEYMLFKSNTARQTDNAVVKFNKTQLESFIKTNNLKLDFSTAVLTTNNHSVPIYLNDDVLYVESLTVNSGHVTMNTGHKLLGTKMNITPTITSEGVNLKVDYDFSKLISMVPLENGTQYLNTMSTSFNYLMPFRSNELDNIGYVYNFKLDNKQYYVVT